MKKTIPVLLLSASSTLLIACQSHPVTGQKYYPPVPDYLLTAEAAPTFKFGDDGSTTNQQIIEDGIRPLYLWGSEGWARVRQIRLLQEKCKLD